MRQVIARRLVDAAEGNRARPAGLLAKAEAVNGTMSPYLLGAIEAEWAGRHGGGAARA